MTRALPTCGGTAPLMTVSPDADVNSTLQLLVEGTLNQVPVVRDERLVGWLCRADILRCLHLRGELGPRLLPAGGSTRPRSEPVR